MHQSSVREKQRKSNPIHKITSFHQIGSKYPLFMGKSEVKVSMNYDTLINSEDKLISIVDFRINYRERLDKYQSIVCFNSLSRSSRTENDHSVG